MSSKKLKFQVKKEYLKGKTGWRVIMPQKDGMFTSIEKGLSKFHAEILAGGLNHCHDMFVKWSDSHKDEF